MSLKIAEISHYSYDAISTSTKNKGLTSGGSANKITTTDLAFLFVHVTALGEAVGPRLVGEQRDHAVLRAALGTGLFRHGRQLTRVRQFCEALGHLLQCLVDVRAWHQSRQLLVFFDKRCLTTQGGFHFGKFD